MDATVLVRRYPSMYYVCIDVAKPNHFASVLSSDGEVLIKPFKFTNDNDGFCRLLRSVSLSATASHHGLESTAHYAVNLVEFLYLITTKSMISPRSRLPQWRRTTYGRLKQIRSIHSLSLKL